MPSILARVLDIRMIWIFMPLWGNLVFLPMLLSVFVSHSVGKLHRVVRIHIVLGIVFFTYFTVRGLIALPDPGLVGAVSRILPIFVIALILWVRPPDVRRAIDLRLVAVVPFVVAVLAVIELEFLTGVTRAGLLGGNPLFLSPAMIPLVYLNCFLAIRAKRLPDSLLHYAGVLVALGVIGVLAGSRSSFAVAIGAILIHIAWVMAAWRPGKQGKHVAIHIGALLLVLFIGLLAAVTLGPSADRIFGFLTAAGKTLAANERVIIWTAGIEAIQDQPWFGYGPQNRWAGMFGYLEDRYFNLRLSHPHNLFVTYGLAGGIVGIVVGVFYIVVPSTLALFSRSFANDDKVLFALGAITVFVFGQANYVLFEGYMAVVSTITLIGPYYLLIGSKDDRYRWSRP